MEEIALWVNQATHVLVGRNSRGEMLAVPRILQHSEAL